VPAALAGMAIAALQLLRSSSAVVRNSQSGSDSQSTPAHGSLPGRPELDEYQVGYISQDGMRHQVSLADAQAVRFEVMAPARARPPLQ